MADIVSALNELGLEVYPTWIDSRSTPTVLQLFANSGGDLVGVLQVESRDASIAEAGIGHFLMITGITSDGDLRTYDPTNRQIRLVQLRESQRLPVILISTEPILPPSTWGSCFHRFTEFLSSKLFTSFLITFAIIYAASHLLTLSLRDNFPRIQLLTASTFVMSVGLILSWYVFHKEVEDKSLSFDATNYQLGHFPVGSTAKGIVRLVNRTNASVEAFQVIASCGCMAVDFKPQEIQPSDVLEIPIQFSQVSLGLNQFHLSVKTNVGEPRCELHFVGDPTLRVEAKYCFVGSVSLSSPELIVHKITIKDHIGKPSRIEAILADTSKSALSIVDFDGEFVDENSGINLQLLPTEHAELGVQFSRFHISTHANDEPLLISFDVGVEFQP